MFSKYNSMYKPVNVQKKNPLLRENSPSLKSFLPPHVLVYKYIVIFGKQKLTKYFLANMQTDVILTNPEWSEELY